MQNSLLAHIAGNFITEYENVANSSVAYLLNEYPITHDVLKDILCMEDVPSYYITELATENNGRPDISGIDKNGNTVVIIEGKFWANLTDNQPVNYLRELGDNGKLLFLAPDKRIVSLKQELGKRLNGVFDKVIIQSWSNFLSLIEKENNKNHNHYLASDLLQITELCKKMDAEGMPPLSTSDLDPMNGRLASQFPDIINECNPLLREWEHSEFKGMKTVSSTYGHGFYFKGYNFGCSLYFDSQKWFTRNIHAPIWLGIQDKGWKDTQSINHALNNFDAISSYKNEYGIILNTGMDKVQIINHIVKKTKDVLGYLNQKLPNEINPDNNLPNKNISQ